MFFDLLLGQLPFSQPERTEPADFDQFWAETLITARTHPLAATITAVATPFYASYRDYGRQPIKGWFLLPRQRNGPLRNQVTTWLYDSCR